MTANLVLIRDGKKFMWDGHIYPTRDEALAAEKAYQSDKFEVCVTEVEGQFSVYTRRPVAQAAAAQ